MNIVLLGDSIFDNARYVAEGQSVGDLLIGEFQRARANSAGSGLGADSEINDQLARELERAHPPSTWVRLLAVDGSIASGVREQMIELPRGDNFIIVSTGGNDALGCVPLTMGAATSMRDALTQLAAMRSRFARDYQAMLDLVIAKGFPVAVCTIYDRVPQIDDEMRAALAIFNDVITRSAAAASVPVIDLRVICTEEEDYSYDSPIEPSEKGGAKIARAIADLVLKRNL